MKAIRKRPGEAPETIEVENTLAALQTEVGGYIEKGDALNAILSEYPDAHYPSWFAEKIAMLHSADVAPVVHGRWSGLEYDGYADGTPVYDLWECSKCGEEIRGEDVPETHLYCPCCGAKMDKEDKHEQEV